MNKTRLVGLTFTLATLALRPASAAGSTVVNGAGTLLYGDALFGRSNPYFAQRPDVSTGALTMESYSRTTAPLHSRTNAALEKGILDSDAARHFTAPGTYPQPKFTTASAGISSNFGGSSDTTFFEGSIQPLPEPSIWIVAAMAAGLLLFKLRNQFRNALARCLAAMSARGRALNLNCSAETSNDLIYEQKQNSGGRR